jgi:hypothetical protein
VVFCKGVDMSNKKPFSAQRIVQCLDVLDQLRVSGLAAREFAAAHQHSYDQLRAWLRHEPRWRAGTQAKQANHLKHFVPVHINASEPTRGAPHVTPSIRIECNGADGKRSASVQFPLSDVKISAQWLAAYMSA